MEMRYKEMDRARNIFERYVRCIPTVKSWVRFAKAEMKEGEISRARRCYERAVEELGEDAQTVSPLVSSFEALGTSSSLWAGDPASLGIGSGPD